MHRITKGLDVPLSAQPEQEISAGPPVTRVALLGSDYVGMKPTMAVQEGDNVKLGQVLFTDKKNPEVKYTSPGCGKVVALNRGAKRVFQSMVIELAGDESETFATYGSDLSSLTREQVQENLINSGLWPCFRTRPYSKVPVAGSVPHSIFVTAIDTNPLAARVEPIVNENAESFTKGLHAIRHLTDGKLFVCKAAGTMLDGADLDFVQKEEFEGPHPAGLPGTHIHLLDPVSDKKCVWHINYQDVIAIGKLFETGKLSVDRVISLAGPMVKKPRLIRTRIGACIDELVSDELEPGDARVISGSVLSGRDAKEPFNFLGRYHLQISAIKEGNVREFLGWQGPGFDKFSVKRIFASALSGDKKFDLTTSTQGSPRAMVPIGTYEKVMPLDVIPTFLLRALIIDDTEQAQALGCLELDEEDLSLCTFVCPGKYDYAPMLRKNLTTIELDG